MEILNAVYKNGVLVLIDRVDPAKLKSKKISIKIIDEVQHKKVQITRLIKIYKYLHKSNPFSSIRDVVKWQRKIRTDREIFN